ncbi:hypothetical protein RNI52_21870 [Labrys neptuniae]|uniref:Nitrate reductase n=1 Tax=Labrys neptuniae TaxID=376174 RepID=A0ABV3PRM6_9HYPH|nr:hypothetical protein [Labrys neptuniae]MDT3379990.1 hypothetical protein [Labrys neptuniae]
MVFGLFRKPSQADRDKAAAIKQMVREILDLGEDTTISVSEIQCGDAACPGTETVILVMQPGVKTKAYKVLAPLVEVERVQVEQALAG